MALTLRQQSVRATQQSRSALTRRPVRATHLRVRAELNEAPKPLANVANAVDGFLKRYDVASTGLGAMVVTGYCVYGHGQDPWTALQITFTATVFALVLNELLFSNKQE